MDQPLVTIITPSFNQAAFIEKTISSVMNQDVKGVQHIIMDGGSTDGTVDILRRNPHLQWFSEKDGGQGDAVNKGLKLAKGKIIGWINSDDYYFENILGAVANAFEDEQVMWLVGNLVEVDHVRNCTRHVKSPLPSYDALVENPDIVKQPATFFRRSFLEEVGALDPGLHMVMDYELWLRLSRKSTPYMLDRDLANFVIHKNQKTSTKNIVRQMKEIKKVLLAEGVSKRIISGIMWRKRKSLLKRYIKDLIGA